VNRRILKGIMPTCNQGKSKIVMMFRSGNFWLAPRTYCSVAGKEMYMELKIACSETGVAVGTIDDHRIRYEGS
jgi:hypothetical protein